MTNFEWSERNLRDKQIEEKIEGMTFAEVKAVKERHPEVLEDEARWEQEDAGTMEATGYDKITDHLDRQHEVDLSPPQMKTLASAIGDGDSGGPIGDTLRDVPVIANMIGESKVPSEGDYALVAFTENFNDREPIVIGWRHNTEQWPPVARRGTYRYQRGDGEADIMLEIYKDKERDKQDGIPEYGIFGTRDPEEQDTPPSPADNFIGLLEKGSPRLEERPVDPAVYDEEYYVVVEGEDGPRIEVDFDATNEERRVLIEGNGAPMGHKFEMDYEDGGSIRIDHDEGSYIEMRDDGSIEINAPAGVTVNSSTVVTEDGQVNDTSSGTGGDITSPGSGGGS